MRDICNLKKTRFQNSIANRAYIVKSNSFDVLFVIYYKRKFAEPTNFITIQIFT